MGLSHRYWELPLLNIFLKEGNYPLCISNAKGFLALSIWDLFFSLSSVVQVSNDIKVPVELLTAQTALLPAFLDTCSYPWGFICVHQVTWAEPVLNGICAGKFFTQSKEQTWLEMHVFRHRTEQVWQGILYHVWMRGATKCLEQPDSDKSQDVLCTCWHRGTSKRQSIAQCKSCFP